MIRPKKLLVEGGTDKRVVPYLMEANGVVWESAGQPVVYIEPYGGINDLLKPGVIESELKASGLEALGVMVDANGDAHNQWKRVRTRCHDQFDQLPHDIPAGGLDVFHSDGPRFGVWIMPNNQFSGMLEDFLIQLIPDDSQRLYELAQNCVSEAARHAAPFKEVHKKKAEIHTWLAWQDEPGPQLHQAVHHRVLDPEKPESQSFVNWFRSLFEV